VSQQRDVSCSVASWTGARQREANPIAAARIVGMLSTCAPLLRSPPGRGPCRCDWAASKPADSAGVDRIRAPSAHEARRASSAARSD